MKYLLALLSLLWGIVESIIRWVLFLPFILFTLPIRKWNDIIYGKDKKTATFLVRETKNGKVELILPNGDIIYADKINKD
jgi:hypothetical protein